MYMYVCMCSAPLCSSLEHEQALVRFSRMSKKKETEKTKFEGDGDLYIATKMYNNVRTYMATK